MLTTHRSQEVVTYFEVCCCRASLYERPVNLESAKKAHSEFRRVMREHGIKVSPCAMLKRDYGATPWALLLEALSLSSCWWACCALLQACSWKSSLPWCSA